MQKFQACHFKLIPEKQDPFICLYKYKEPYSTLKTAFDSWQNIGMVPLVLYLRFSNRIQQHTT